MQFQNRSCRIYATHGSHRHHSTPSCLGLPSTIEVAVINQCRATMSLGEGLGYLHCIYLALSCTSALSVAILVWLLGLL